MMGLRGTYSATKWGFDTIVPVLRAHRHTNFHDGYDWYILKISRILHPGFRGLNKFTPLWSIVLIIPLPETFGGLSSGILATEGSYELANIRDSTNFDDWIT